MKRKSLKGAALADDEWDESMQSVLEDTMEENLKRVKRLPSTDIGLQGGGDACSADLITHG